MEICVVGTGYVGLVTGACLADFGMTVTGVDKDEAKVKSLQNGEIPIYEPGLASIVHRNMEQGRLSFTTDLGPSLEKAAAIFIAVGTPPRPDGAADLTFVRQVAESIAEHLNGYKVIVTKSTVPTGTGQMIEEIITKGRNGDHEFAIVSNPEFLREGSAIEDFMQPDRVVIGTRDQRAIDIMLDIYSPLKVADVPFVITGVESAELIKYASNGFLATKISFINEVAQLCEALDADVLAVSRGMGLDSRIGPKFLHPGPGFGGSCFPKDSRAAAQIATELGHRFRIMESVLEVNEVTKKRMVDKIKATFGSLDGLTLGVLGLSFKPDTDDMRESPALTIVGELLNAGVKIRTYDPEAMDECREIWKDQPVAFCDDSYDAATGTDGLIIVTEWNQFRHLELEKLKKVMRGHVVIDLRNIYDPPKMASAGFRYVSLGRPEAGADTASNTAADDAAPNS